MARLSCTIWALLLNICGLPIFQTCFANAMEDEEGESLLVGPPITSFLFSAGVYIIIVSSTLFPQSFQEPKAVFLVLYEFLATAFLLEFATACIWTPIDVLILTTLPRGICHLLKRFGFEDASEAFTANKSTLSIVTHTISIAFFLVALHVTDSADFTIPRDYGVAAFASHLWTKLRDRVLREFPRSEEGSKAACRCKTRGRGHSKSRASYST